MKRLSWYVYFCLILALAACQTAPTPGKVLFQDDFSNPGSGWDRMTGYDGETDYREGAYRIFVDDVMKHIYANPGLNFTDARIEVDAQLFNGPETSDYGIICRYTDVDNFYYFIIGSDGYYGIGSVVAGDRQMLAPTGDYEPNPVIHSGVEVNHLRADCVDDTLTLYVNEQKLVEVQDTALTSGDVGLIAGSFEEPGVDIRFDNFAVVEP